MRRKKERLDKVLVEQHGFSSRTQAQRAVMAREVWVDGVPADKPAQSIPLQANIEVRRRRPLYVSRGGHKLAPLLAVWGVEVQGCRALDIGASTGGFTDCLLQHGAALVYAIDVGRGQLAWKLRQDARVKVHERTHVARVSPGLFSQGLPQLLTVDLSFIGITPLLAHFRSFVATGAKMMLLVKPQFEAKRGSVGKRGVVRDTEVHQQVLTQVVAAAYAAHWRPRGCQASPLRGPQGNVEFFWYMEAEERASSPPPSRDWSLEIAAAIAQAPPS